MNASEYRVVRNSLYSRRLHESWADCSSDLSKAVIGGPQERVSSSSPKPPLSEIDVVGSKEVKRSKVEKKSDSEEVSESADEHSVAILDIGSCTWEVCRTI